MKFKLILLLSLFYGLNLFSQETISFPQAEAESYRMYLNKNWEELIEYSKKVRKFGIDFYYLDVRTGIAYYEIKKYMKAIKFLEKAYSQSPVNEVVQEYLYYSYMFSGRYSDMRRFGAGMTEKLKTKTEYRKLKFFNSLTVEYKFDLPDDYQYTSATFPVEQKTTNRLSYYSLGFEHILSKRISIFHSYSRISAANTIQQLPAFEIPSIMDSSLKQNEYYLLLKSNLSKGLDLKTAFHYIYTKEIAPVSTTWRRFGQPILYSDISKTFTGHISLNIIRNNFNFDFGTSAYIAQINSKLQPHLSIKFFPLSNYKFYSNTAVFYDLNPPFTGRKNLAVFKQSFGFMPASKILVELSGFYGNMNNFIEHDAYIINNGEDIIKYKGEILTNFSMFKGTRHLFFRYQYELKENSYQVGPDEFKTEYNNHTILGGLKWYF